MARSRHYATYGELFIEYLDQLFARGGSAYDMVRVAKIYESQESEMRQCEFQDWLRQTGAFACNRCGRVFSPQKTVGEGHEPICTWC